MEKWNKNICLTNRKTITVIAVILFSTLVLASVWPGEVEEIIEEGSEEEMWVPTKEDIQYQDSMYTIIQNTQSDVDTIKIQVQMIIERLDYSDGSWDSIRYVNKNKENLVGMNQMIQNGYTNYPM